jgi:pimeloyl-ACP methyl ester carboxylesterase
MTVFFVCLAVVASIVLAGALYQLIGKHLEGRRFPAPGKYLEVNGRRVHLRDEGAGRTVVLEAGIASTSLAWVGIQRMLRKEARVIAYDRAGLGWSDRPRTPRTLDNIVDELHTVLEQSGAPKPYVLVGHSFGGLIVRSFALRFPEECAGLVLVDPVNTRDWVPLSDVQKRRLARGVALSRRGALLARLGVVRFALSLLVSGNRRLPQLISRWSAGRGASVTERLTGEVRKLPEEVWPMVKMHWSDEKCFTTMAEYLERLPENAAAAEERAWPRGMAITALTVLTSVPELPAYVTHRVAQRSGHWIQLDEPELVIDAIRELLHVEGGL